VDVLFDGTEAGDQARTVDDDCVVLDLMVPGRSGFQVLRDIRRSDAGARRSWPDRAGHDATRPGELRSGSSTPIRTCRAAPMKGARSCSRSRWSPARRVPERALIPDWPSTPCRALLRTRWLLPPKLIRLKRCGKMLPPFCRFCRRGGHLQRPGAKTCLIRHDCGRRRCRESRPSRRGRIARSRRGDSWHTGLHGPVRISSWASARRRSLSRARGFACSGPVYHAETRRCDGRQSVRYSDGSSAADDIHAKVYEGG
jgi:hypothetical protein